MTTPKHGGDGRVLATVYIRPHVIDFLRKINDLNIEMVIYSKATACWGNTVVNGLEQRVKPGFKFLGRFFRGTTTSIDDCKDLDIPAAYLGCPRKSHFQKCIFSIFSLKFHQF